MTERLALRLVAGGYDADGGQGRWFCGHCAVPSSGGAPPPPTARVCTSCGLGLMLEARADLIPTSREAFLVVDCALLVQAMSQQAQVFLGVDEERAVNQPVDELLVPADAEASGRTGFAAAIVQAAEGQDADGAHRFVRPRNTFGVRMRARIATCGPPRAALVILEGSSPRGALHAAEGSYHGLAPAGLETRWRQYLGGAERGEYGGKTD